MRIPTIVLIVSAALGIGGCAGALPLPWGLGGSRAEPVDCRTLPTPEVPGPRENLGPCVNTESDEALPRISPDGRVLYFLRARHPENVGGAEAGEDIWSTRLDADGEWVAAENMGKPLNNALNNFVFSAMPGDNTLLLGNTYNTDGTMSSGVSLVNRSKTGWDRPANVHIDNWYNRDRWVSYSLSSDGQVLVMHAERDDSRGLSDLYVSFRNSDGSWSEPRNLGIDVNTADHEITPFLAADNVTLYFSSAGHGGLGDQDVFMSRRLDDSWTRWSEPVNLGETVNTAGFDAYFTLAAAADWAYIVSSEHSIGGYDIFRLPVTEGLRPRPVVLLSGRVLDEETKEPIGAAIVYGAVGDSARSGGLFSHPGTGEYSVVLPAGDYYNVRAEATRYVGAAAEIDLTAVDAYEEIERDLYLSPVRSAIGVILSNVYFDFGEATLRPESRAELDRVLDFMRENPTIAIRVMGHTDAIGNDDWNEGLAVARATRVRDYLLDAGLDADRVEVQAFGEKRPLTTNETDDGRQQNRRVELRIIDI